MSKGSGRPSGLSAREERFCQAMMSASSQSEAYRQTFPESKKWKAETVTSKASSLMARENVRKRVEQLRAEVASKLSFTEKDVLEAVGAILFADVAEVVNEAGNQVLGVREMPAKFRQAIQGIDVEALFDTVDDGEGKPRRMRVGSVLKYRLADKNSAAEKLMKFFGSFEKDNNQGLEPLRRLLDEIAERGSRLPVAED